MPPTIIEQFIQSKSGFPDLCEDGLFISRHFIAVIDGVTGKGSLRWPEEEGMYRPDSMTSGIYARCLLMSALEQMPADADALSAIIYLNNRLTEASRCRLEYLKTHPEERLQAVIVLYSCLRKEIWCFGDCQYITDGERFTHPKKIDELLSELRSLYNQAEMVLGSGLRELTEDDSGRRAILPLLRRQMVLANTDSPWGYDVLDGFDIHPERTVIHKVAPGTQVVLASDGYPDLRPTLAESEAALAELLTKDPLCIWENRGTKGLVQGNLSYDDRTYVRFSV